MLMGIGILCIYAAEPQESFWIKQLAYSVIGLAAFVFVNVVDYRSLGPLSYWLYAVVIVLLGVAAFGGIFATACFLAVNSAGGKRRQTMDKDRRGADTAL